MYSNGVLPIRDLAGLYQRGEGVGCKEDSATDTSRAMPYARSGLCASRLEARGRWMMSVNNFHAMDPLLILLSVS